MPSHKKHRDKVRYYYNEGIRTRNKSKRAKKLENKANKLRRTRENRECAWIKCSRVFTINKKSNRKFCTRCLKIRKKINRKKQAKIQVEL